MGDWADLMLDGVVCQSCGVYLGDAVGYPRSCANCESVSHGDSKEWTHSDPTEPVQHSDTDEAPFDTDDGLVSPSRPMTRTCHFEGTVRVLHD
jgi:hypothetical protein